MVTQAPKKTAVFAAIAFSLSCVGLIIFVWTQFGGTIPLAPQGYRVKALFQETGLLVPNADVRIAGVNVGKVSSVKAEGLDSLVTLDLNSKYAPIPKDTRAVLRQKTLLGEAYIELSTGSGSGTKLPDEGTIPTSHVEKTQALDQVLASFNTKTQHNLQALLNGFGAALAGRGETLNDAVGSYDPFATELAAVVGVLNEQQANLRAIFVHGGEVLNTLGDRSADLQKLITAGNNVFETTAATSGPLKTTVNELPAFFSQLRTTFTRLNTTLGIARPSLQALRPVTPLLTPALRQISHVSKPALSILRAAPTLLTATNKALPRIGDFAHRFTPAVNALLPAAQQIEPIISYMFSDRQNIVAAMANLAASLQGVTSADEPGGTAHYLRALLSVGDESVFGQSVRNPTVRNNAYYAPGELNDLATGLKTASCANLTNSTAGAVMIPGLGNVPCVVQSPVAWGSKIAPTGYYPRVGAAKK